MKKLFILFAVLLFPLITNGKTREINTCEKKSIESVLIDFVDVDDVKLISYLIEDILTEETTQFENWMFDDNYLNTEEGPVIEAWMFDENYFNKKSII